jgi:hypothetical protein
VAIGWKPRRKEFIPNLQTIQFRKGKVLPDRFLQENNINLVNSKEIFELVSAASAPKPSNVPNEHFHLDTLRETHACRAEVLRSV